GDDVEVEQLALERAAGGLVEQHRVGGEEAREEHEVAQEEDPESVADDDAERRRPARAVAARLVRRGGVADPVGIAMAERGAVGGAHDACASRALRRAARAWRSMR